MIIHNSYTIYNFIIQSDTPEHIDALRMLYCCTESVSFKPCQRIVIQRASASFYVTYNGRSTLTEHPIQLVQKIIFENQKYAPYILPLHAGGIEAGGKAWLFLASTGTGKTTLITYLTSRGYTYINDDRIFINHNSLKCVAHVTPVHLRPESIPILENNDCYIKGKLLEIETIQRIVYMPKTVVVEDMPIGGIYFITRCDNENSCTPLSGGEAVQRLMQNLLTSLDGSASLRCAVKLARYCHELKFSRLSYVYDLLKDLLIKVHRKNETS